LVDAFLALTPMVDALSATIRTYQADPEAVSPEERLLLDLAHEVAVGRLDIEGAYLRVAEAVAALGIDDAAFYVDVLENLFGRSGLERASPSEAASP